jgi:multiple sugar transport system ATP-binding protein
MAEIALRGLTKQFGAMTAVAELSLTIPDKEFVALLGPSGCGKTTTMNMIAGIESPSGGQILFDGRDVQRLAPERRGVGFVFQNYAIFTHMSVYENLAFGLRVRRLSHGELDAKVRKMASLMQLTDRLDWPSRRLSVNELQKLAIGRSAIVEPSIFLLDEPLSNLDAAFREFMRTELKHIQHQLQQTMVYVTHDQVEAMSLADRIAVMDRGVLQQYGTPDEVFNDPANTFVANFMGSPSMNLIPCRLQADGGEPVLQVGEAGTIRIVEERLRRAAQAAGSRDVVLGIRPEVIAVETAADPGQALQLEVDLVEPIGPRSIVHLRAGALEVLAVKDKRFAGALKSRIWAVLPQAHCHLFDAQTGKSLGGRALGRRKAA